MTLCNWLDTNLVVLNHRQSTKLLHGWPSAATLIFSRPQQYGFRKCKHIFDQCFHCLEPDSRAPFNVKRAVSLSSAYKLSYCSGSELFVQMLLLTKDALDHYYVLYIVALRAFLLSITTTIAVLRNGNVYLAKYLPLKTRERSNLGRPWLHL